MIRIDLGKDELQKAPKGGKPLNLGPLEPLLERVRNLGGRGRRRAALTNDVRRVVAVVVTIALACLPHLFFGQYKSFVNGQHQVRMRSLQEKADAVNQEILKLQPFQKELQSYEQQKKLVRDRLDIVRQLLLSRGTPVNVLDALGQSLPRRTWITSLALSLASTPPGLKVTGSSYSNEDVSDFIDKLTESVFFSEVRLEDVDPGKADGKIDVRAFVVKAVPKIKVISAADPPGAAPRALASRPQ